MAKVELAARHTYIRANMVNAIRPWLFCPPIASRQIGPPQ